jgi:pimeloyl-ACP methyl ester carboxylesterase
MENIFLFREKRIHYCDDGEGDTIILIHGYLESAETWSSFSKKLSKNFRIISVDLPGHGHSDVFTNEDSMEFLASLIKELLNHIGIEKVFLTGHSLGGYITLAFLELYPERLTGYCLFHSHPSADSEEATAKRKREIRIVTAGEKDLIYQENVTRMFAEENLDNFPEALLRSKEIASKISSEGIISVLQGMMSRPSRISLLEEGRVPCLWILGKKDNYIPFEAIQKRVNLPSNADVAILENSGHLGFIEEEDLSVKIISEFVKKLKN